MDPAFQLASSPRPHVCLRLKLQTFTLGHWFLLARYCPSVVDLENREPVNLTIAVLICSQPFDRSARDLPRWWMRPICFLWGLLCRHLDHLEEARKFAAYLREGMSAPRVNMPVNLSPRETSAPIGYWLLSVLMAEFHLSERAALAMPVTRALCLRAAHAEHTGQVQLASTRSRTLWDYFQARKQQPINGEH